ISHDGDAILLRGVDLHASQEQNDLGGSRPVPIEAPVLLAEEHLVEAPPKPERVVLETLHALLAQRKLPPGVIRFPIAIRQQASVGGHLLGTRIARNGSEKGSFHGSSSRSAVRR